MAFDVFSLVGRVALEGIDVVSRGLKDLEGKVKNVEKRFDAAGSRLKTFNNFVQENKSKIQGAGLALSGFAASVGLIGTNVVRTGAEFDTQMRRVKAISGATAEQWEAMRTQAKELGSTTAFTAKQAADGMQFLAQAGFDTKEIMDAMPGTLQLAAAAQLDLGTAADITSNILSGFGMEASELAGINDALINTVNNANTDMVQLGEAMKFVAPVAKAVGVSIEDTSAAIGILGNAGIQASMAGTTLRGAITKILNPSNEAASAMERLGLSAKNADGSFVGFKGIVEQLEKSTVRLNDPVEFGADLMTIFGQRAGPGMQALVNQGSAALEDLRERLNRSGTAASVAEQQMAGIGGSMIEFSSALEGLKISILESGVGDFLQTIIDGAADVVRWLSDLNPMILKWGTITVAAFGAIAAVVGPFLLILPQLVAGFTAVTGTLIGAGGLTASLGAVVTVLTGPVGIVAAVTAAVAAFVLWKTDVDEATQRTNDHKQKVAELEEQILKYADAAKTAKERGDLLVEVGTRLGESYEERERRLSALVEKLKEQEAVQKRVNNLTEFQNRDLVQSIKLYRDAISPLQDQGKAAFELAERLRAYIKAQEDAGISTFNNNETLKRFGETTEEYMDRLNNMVDQVIDYNAKAKEQKEETKKVTVVVDDLGDSFEGTEKDADKLRKQFEKDLKTATKNLRTELFETTDSLDSLAAQMSTVREGYERGLIPLERYADAVKAYDDQVAALMGKLNELSNNQFHIAIQSLTPPLITATEESRNAAMGVLDLVTNLNELPAGATAANAKLSETNQLLKDFNIQTSAEKAQENQIFLDKLDDLRQLAEDGTISWADYNKAVEDYNKKIGGSDGAVKKSEDFASVMKNQVSTIVSDLAKDLSNVGEKGKNAFKSIADAIKRTLIEKALNTLISKLGKVIGLFKDAKTSGTGLSNIFGGGKGGGGGPDDIAMEFGGGDGFSRNASDFTTGEGLAAAAAIGSGFIPGQGRFASSARGALSGAALGFQIGGPIGAGIGAAAGAIAGFVQGLFNRGKKKREDTAVANEIFPKMREAVRMVERDEIGADEAAFVIDSLWKEMVANFQRKESVSSQRQFYQEVVEWLGRAAKDQAARFKKLAEDEEAEAQKKAAQARLEDAGLTDVDADRQELKDLNELESQIMQDFSSGLITVEDRDAALRSIAERRGELQESLLDTSAVDEVESQRSSRQRGGEQQLDESLTVREQRFGRHGRHIGDVVDKIAENERDSIIASQEELKKSLDDRKRDFEVFRRGTLEEIEKINRGESTLVGISEDMLRRSLERRQEEYRGFVRNTLNELAKLDQRLEDVGSPTTGGEGSSGRPGRQRGAGGATGTTAPTFTDVFSTIFGIAEQVGPAAFGALGTSPFAAMSFGGLRSDAFSEMLSGASGGNFESFRNALSNQITISGNEFNVRSEEDIELIARRIWELAGLQGVQVQNL